ncbi:MULTISPECIES: phosphonate ABC transporter, permease protein PhnE [Virgibacillus]|uniref:Phosphate ABC transporter permease n=1 Tax=Virgibacillus pantothenticus TaxID=1473 RepID=A0A0L0QMB2_VIRPA|nr:MULTISPECIES: phosphonate ABC transporter, permease protein PhnE [Virgibacillus]API93382.1 phosphonate ABC transporter, permease protein PhnE [Virgibacillus sp. 6R]KNE19701.1 phosphate ABC transporter permease [Virgibacillus pantothenticus]MBS7428557.1 phosphonate ABC transporter, permease protein PhnE [Virgibacillus sp. 19R1-5]MBU8567626.1 phosphonate ABC transporter, permease protein PhnE [Virgibacillus pantothenticus]MBU8601414.1 phosphonate ABC transporter, permease protein PhnE [Virgib
MKRIRLIMIIVIVSAIYIWAFSGLPKLEWKDTSVEVVSAIFSGLFQPDWDYVYDPDGEDLLRGLLDTLAIALLGTFIAGVLCIPFAFLASKNIVKSKLAVGISKFMLSFIRVFPDIVLALLFIKAVGPGAFAGVLALGIGAVGMLGKLISESVDNVDLSAKEALIASGANPVKTFIFAIVPQVLPNFFSFILYRFEVNVRAAAVLGVIGAGGIGTPLIFALSVRDWERVGIILLGIILMVTFIDLISGKIRARFI